MPGPAAAAGRWLVKTEPGVYSFTRLVADRRTVWDGVTNPLALKHLRCVRKGDLVLVYHTGDERAAVGIARAASDAYPDPKGGDARLAVVDLVPEAPLPRPVTLAEMRANPRLAGFDLLRLGRLSVLPVPEETWEEIQRMSGSDAGPRGARAK